MKSITPTDRDRALQRLRRLTVGAAAGATMAVFGISTLAAASYAGKTSDTSTALNTSSSSSSTGVTITSGSTDSSTDVTAAAPTATPAPAATANSGSAVVTTGGS